MLERSVFGLQEIFYSYIVVSDGRGKLNDDAEEGVLYKNGLPDFTTLLHIQWMSIWLDGRRVSVQTQCISLPLEYAGECPGVRSMIIVHEKVRDEHHGLNGTHGWPAKIGKHA